MRGVVMAGVVPGMRSFKAVRDLLPGKTAQCGAELIALLLAIRLVVAPTCHYYCGVFHELKEFGGSSEARRILFSVQRTQDVAEQEHRFL